MRIPGTSERRPRVDVELPLTAGAQAKSKTIKLFWSSGLRLTPGAHWPVPFFLRRKDRNYRDFSVLGTASSVVKIATFRWLS